MPVSAANRINSGGGIAKAAIHATARTNGFRLRLYSAYPGFGPRAASLVPLRCGPGGGTLRGKYRVRGKCLPCPNSPTIVCSARYYVNRLTAHRSG